MMISILLPIILFRISSSLDEILYSCIRMTLFPYLYMFLLGMFIYHYCNYSLPFLQKYWWALVGLLGLVGIYSEIIALFDGVGYNVLFQILLAGAVLGGAYRIGRIVSFRI